MTIGKFIVFEGIDGSGKTTVAKHVCSRLGSSAIFTSEPFDPEMPGRIEPLLNSSDADSIAAKALFFAADRAVHTMKIREWLAGGSHVICDRYYMSTLAYQGAELGAGDKKMLDWIRLINQPFEDLPDAVIYLDSDPAKSLGRIAGRNSRLKVYESLQFLERVRGNYATELSLFNGHKFVIDADVSLSSLESKSMEAVDSVLGGI